MEIFAYFKLLSSNVRLTTTGHACTRSLRGMYTYTIIYNPFFDPHFCIAICVFLYCVKLLFLCIIVQFICLIHDSKFVDNLLFHYLLVNILLFLVDNYNFSSYRLSVFYQVILHHMRAYVFLN